MSESNANHGESCDSDPFLEEVRELKRRAAERCGYDIDRMVAEAKEMQKDRRVIQPPMDDARAQGDAA